MGILAAKLARAVYHVLTKKLAFDEQRFGTASSQVRGSNIPLEGGNV